MQSLGLLPTFTLKMRAKLIKICGCQSPLRKPLFYLKKKPHFQQHLSASDMLLQAAQGSFFFATVMFSLLV